MKTHMIKMKKAAATCMRKDAPELDLPLFNNEFRLANVLTRRPRIGQVFYYTFSFLQTNPPLTPHVD